MPRSIEGDIIALKFAGILQYRPSPLERDKRVRLKMPRSIEGDIRALKFAGTLQYRPSPLERDKRVRLKNSK
jgi:hypothetical protein